MPKNTAVRWGDFTGEAVPYSRRPPYADEVLMSLAGLARSKGEPTVAELGAGTGNLLRSLELLGLSGHAIEPNPAMRAKAAELASGNSRFHWRHGTAETTGLEDGSIDWIIIGNAFQFMQPNETLVECNRILRSKGLLSIIWLLRDFEHDPLQRSIEEMLRSRFPRIRRISGKIDGIMDTILRSTMYQNSLYCESRHTEELSHERLLSVWMADHDAPSQIAEKDWKIFIEDVRSRIPDRTALVTHWWTRCWVFRQRDPA